MKKLVLIKGAGDLATAVGHKLFRSGFQVVMTDINVPTCIRRTVSFANCIFEEEWEVEGVKAKRALTHLAALDILEEGVIPVIPDPEGVINEKLSFDVVIDAILAKKNLGTYKMKEALVIGLGPGFTAGEDVDVVIETNRGHNLGRIILKGRAEADTGIPGNIVGFSRDRLLKSPVDGVIKNIKKIGDRVIKGDIVATVNGCPVTAAIDGILRGLIYEGIEVKAGLKIGDIDPRIEPSYITTISDKGRCIAGGVLEAILMWENEIGNEELRMQS
ncbi:selenium-dependent molybdenum cofactor biosynthesis protein YqeB [Alkaliphilus serpentinus]|uniref:EF2563 family selenium-dependent molybdenum hydroxylase system protein n=1 Tax=Alkaliphilus serpentinus TaxID=1482731 RepID=A0A833M905_9FIRM|nr:selenium-dependent molybdenum cofactor biosynthesis protein YqeB [Alkaliphilus serpentinus]KAB3532097.1 EF2563 family selenium-dependent molybdenum hydroxylase system protein [Alkaliphilus serpentinus]